MGHLSHFCAVISRTGGADNSPIYDIDPPDFHIGWHSAPTALPAFQGPWHSTVTLPRSLPIPQRSFRTSQPYGSKLAAHNENTRNELSAHQIFSCCPHGSYRVIDGRTNVLNVFDAVVHAGKK